MKSALKTIIFTYISVLYSQHIILSLIINSQSSQNFHLFVIGLSALYFFGRPIFAILGLPSKGIGFLTLNFALTLALIYTFILFVPLISVEPSIVSGLKLFGFVLPSKSFTEFWSVVFTSLLIATVYSFLDWLCKNKS